MKRMSPEERQALETAIRWQSHQKYDRNTVLMIMAHVEAVEWELEAQLKVNRQLVDLEKEMKIELDRRVSVPREVAEAREILALGSLSHDGIGWAVFNIMVSRESMLEEPARIIKRHFGTNHFELMEFFVNGYVVEMTPEDYVGQEYRAFLAKGDGSAAAAVEMVLGILGKDDLLHRLRNEVH